MHRVELKGVKLVCVYVWEHGVPNAPCGVERVLNGRLLKSLEEFLMHRVELKDKQQNTSQK